MKKIILAFLVFISISYSILVIKNKDDLVYNNSIYSFVKVHKIICSRALQYNETNKQYDWCVANVTFLPEKIFQACTFSRDYCMNISVKNAIVVLHPILWDPLMNDSKKCYYNKTTDCDVCINENTYLIHAIFSQKTFFVDYAKKQEYNMNISEILVYLLIIAVAYYLFKKRR